MKKIITPIEYNENEDEKYNQLCNDIIQSIGKQEIERLLSWEFCELDYEFLGFLENYNSLKDIPQDYAIIDFGCCQAIQGDYFKNHIAYIGVEPSVPNEYRLKQDNALYYQQTIKEFIDNTLPKLIANGIDINKAIAICSAVPDFKETAMITEIFPYYKIAYPSMETKEILPSIPAPEVKTEKRGNHCIGR